MTDMPAMMLWTDAYLADTAHLTTAEHGAYLLVLMAMWRSGGSLPNDETRLARLAKLPVNRWRAMAPTILEFMAVEGDVITQKRLVSELKIANEKREKNRLNGRFGGLAKANKNNSSHLANASQTPIAKSLQGSTIPEPEPEPDKERDSKPPSLNPDPAPEPSAQAAPDAPLAGLRKAIVQAFAQAGSMTLSIDTHRAAIWLERGFKPQIILAVIGEQLARKPHIRSLAYFDTAIAEAHAKPGAAAVSDAPAKVMVDVGMRFPADEKFLIEAIAEYRREPGCWEKKWRQYYGYPPDHPACRIPRKYRADLAPADTGQVA